MQDTLKKIGIPLALLIIGIALGRFAGPTKKEIVETEKVVEKIVEKKVFVKVKEEKKEIVKSKTTITKPDGTTIVKEVEEEKTDSKVSEENTEEKEDSTTKEIYKKIFVERKKPQYKADLVALHKEDTNIEYGAHIQMRLQGPFFVGVMGLHDGNEQESRFGLTFGMEF